MKKALILTGGLAVCFIIAASAMAGDVSGTRKASAPENLIRNGGFEEGTNPGEMSIERTGSKKISNWEVTKESVDYIGGYFPCHKSKRCIDMDGTPGPGEISQTIRTVSGEKYLVTFAVNANRQGPPELKQLRVAAAGQSQTVSYNIRKEKKWKILKWEFTADSDSATIVFTSANGTGSGFGILLDDVSVTPVKGHE